MQHYSPDYEETQTFSPRFQQFLDEICDDQDRKYHLGGKTALEIGCGKGEFLVALCERTGCAGIGIDPGYRPERTDSAAAARLTFIQDFYGPKYRHLQADYVCCRHTLEHIGAVRDFMRLVREASATGRASTCSSSCPTWSGCSGARVLGHLLRAQQLFHAGLAGAAVPPTGFEVTTSGRPTTSST